LNKSGPDDVSHRVLANNEADIYQEFYYSTDIILYLFYKWSGGRSCGWVCIICENITLNLNLC